MRNIYDLLSKVGPRVSYKKLNSSEVCDSQVAGHVFHVLHGNPSIYCLTHVMQTVIKFCPGMEATHRNLIGKFSVFLFVCKNANILTA